MTKPWSPLCNRHVQGLPGQLGVYQVADAEGTVIRIGMAGGRSLFGLRSELEQELEQRTQQSELDLMFRYEVTMSYLTRFQELLMIHVADHGELPRDNQDALPVTLGRLHPG